MGDVAVPADEDDEDAAAAAAAAAPLCGWQNLSFQLCQQQIGEDKFRKRMDRLNQTQAAGFGSKTKLSMKSSKAKKSVMGSRSFLRQYNAVGAVGYATVLSDPQLPNNSFFTPGKRFRIRLRHSNLSCDDDADACIRETAIKFADQNEDGPFDLILHTGRTALARNCKTFLEVLQHRKPEQIKQLCLKDPHFYFALVDGLRKAPSSYTELHYYSQLPYKLIPIEDDHRVLKFRLIPAADVPESGFLDAEEQEAPWQTGRRPADHGNDPAYLREEFLKKLGESGVQYILQVQTCQRTDEDIAWNPQVMWKEDSYPWTNLAEVNLTTPLTCPALRRTYFNIVDKPMCLKFPPAPSVHDFRSLAHVYCSMYTTIEIKRLASSHVSFPSDTRPSDPVSQYLTTHVVSLCTGHQQEVISSIDVFVTLTGTRGRTTPQKLLHQATNVKIQSPDELTHYQIETEPVGEILALTINIKHRHITDDWLLRYVIVTDPERQVSRHFPCHSVVFSKVTLRPGEATLPQQEQHEVLKQERQLELRERQANYQWQKVPGLPSHIRGKALNQLPINEQMIAEKFSVMQWDLDNSFADLFVPLLGSVRATSGHHGRDTSMMKTGGMGMGVGLGMMQMGMSMPGMGMGVMGKGGMGMGMGMGKGGMGMGMGMGKGGMGMGMMGKGGMGMGMGMNMMAKGMGMPGMGMGMGMGMNPNMAAMLAMANPMFGMQGGAGASGQTFERKPMDAEKRKRARNRWKKIKMAVRFISRVKLPPGPAGDMCRQVEDDVAFGRLFTLGYNPNILRRCTELPENFPVTDQNVEMILDRKNTTLEQEMQVGRVYIADYGILDGMSGFHREKYVRHLSAPFCLLYVRSSGDLIPIAIQLHQEPADDNPIWTPSDMAEEWIMAKLWVRCADFHYQHFIEHVMKCHLVTEPFAVATLRQLSTSHPVYKLLKPHFRYTLVGNTLMRAQLLSPGTAVDRWSAIGSEGFKVLARKFFLTFSFDLLDLPLNLKERGVDDIEKLPYYYYRDDSLKLWQAISTYCHKIINIYYESDNCVQSDCEIQGWIKDIAQNGFGSVQEASISGSIGLRDTLNSREELGDLVTKVLFNATCQHSAVHCDGLDVYGFMPLQPSSMRRPAPTCKHNVTKKLLLESLPEHSPENYNGSLSTTMGMCPADQNPLGCNRETYFVDAETRLVKDEFSRELSQISRDLKARNAASRTAYECLLPWKIPNSVEPVPFQAIEMPEVPENPPPPSSNCVRRGYAIKTGRDNDRDGDGDKDGDGDRDSGTDSGHTSPSVPVMTLPLCLNFAQTMGGDSLLARRLTVDLFSRAMQKVQGNQVQVPLGAIDKNKFSLTRCQLNVAMNMANGSAKTC